MSILTDLLLDFLGDSKLGSSSDRGLVATFAGAAVVLGGAIWLAEATGVHPPHDDG